MENNELLEQVRSKAQGWLTESYDAETRAAVQALLDKEDPTELIESFYKDLEFGTGGLRGIMGVGSNRMNIYTVGAATQGLSNYLKKEFTDVEQIKVVIGHDCRNNSRKFAEISADIFSANGIKVYIFESLRPTPEMSYAIRKLGCQSGIILTASHNAARQEHDRGSKQNPLGGRHQLQRQPRADRNHRCRYRPSLRSRFEDRFPFARIHPAAQRHEDCLHADPRYRCMLVYAWCRWR